MIPGFAAYKCAAMRFAVGYSMREFTYIAEQLDRDALAKAGLPDISQIVTSEIPLSALPAMFDTLRGSNNETKVHVLL